MTVNKTTHCDNCNNPLSATDNYCNHCGQSTLSFNTDFWTIIKPQLEELLDIDNRIARTLNVLITRPGEITRAYNAGHRLRYTPPLRLYLATSILFFLLYAYLPSIYTAGLTLEDNASEYFARAMFFLFPMFALLNQVFFKSSRFIGNLVFSLHLHSIVYLVLIIITPLEANEHQYPVFVWLQLPPSLYLGWYYISAYKRVFQESWLKTIIKSSFVFFIYMGLMGIAFDVILKELM